MALMEAEQQTTCKATTTAGTHCRANAMPHGYCYFHSPANKTQRHKASQNGGHKSAAVRRAQRGARDEQLRSGREVLRSAFQTDEAWRKALVDAYRRPVMAGGKEALSAASELINQIEGKPQQNIQSKHEVSIVVVSRLDAALEQAADVELPAADVHELTA